MTVPHVDFEFDTLTVPCTAKDLRATFGWLLLEMRAVAKVLRPDERDLLRKIMSHAGATLTVRGLFPEFRREGEAHKTLRRLRAAQFVYPKKTGRWEPDEPVAVTPFARKIWDQVGEERIFSPPPVPPKGTAIDMPTPPPKQPVVTWDNLLERIRERQKSLAVGPGTQQQS
ncbi:MAG: hypothetical protein J0I06_03360 [Planctomycetes bacterium]|nr:hypothetical protein [Planctomycetota bacterium]